MIIGSHFEFGFGFDSAYLLLAFVFYADYISGHKLVLWIFGTLISHFINQFMEKRIQIGLPDL